MRRAARISAMVWVCLCAGFCHAAQTYYVHCDAGAGDGSGSSEANPIRMTAVVNAHVFRAGDRILFKRGSECHGMLAPRGSGSESNPIELGAYGEGPRPRIVAGTGDSAALQFINQEYWNITSLDISGGTQYGVLVKADRGVMHHIHLSELTVHDVGMDEGEMKVKASGLVVVTAVNPLGGFEDVVIDSVIASYTRRWSGIYIAGGHGPLATTHAVVRNSIVHDVEGDGIVLFHVHDGLIENSAAWRTGMEHSETMGTPNAIWTWACDHCVVQNNEAYLSESPGLDGGAFDIDFWDTANIFRGNYGHDTQGYCVSVFGAFSVTKDSVVSGNLCIRNGMSPRLGRQQGAIFFTTWENGSMDGITVEGNTVYWDPPGDFPPIQLGDDDPKIRNLTISKNTIYSTAFPFVAEPLEFEGSGNQFILVTHGPADPVPDERGVKVEIRQVKPGNIACWSGCAFIEGTGPSGGSLLAAWLSNDASVRAQELVMLKSQAQQFRPTGLHVVATCRCDAAEAQQLSGDWQLAGDGITLTGDDSHGPPAITMTLTAEGHTPRTWTTVPTVPELGLAVRQAVGDPVFGRMPSLPKPY